MNSKRTPNKKKNLTPIFVSSVIGLVAVFFLALFLIQPSSDENYLGGEINVIGESLPDLSVNFNRDCVLFENLNYCQQLEPAAKMEAPIISGSDLNGNSIDCFSNPGGRWDKQRIVNIKKNRFQIKLSEGYVSGRARLNCTTKIDDNWHWFGYQFLVK